MRFPVPTRVALITVLALAAACHSPPATSQGPAASNAVASAAPAPSAPSAIPTGASPSPAPSTSAPPSAEERAAPIFDAANGVVGGLRIGMARRDALRVLPLVPHPSGQMGDNVRVAGPYYVVFDKADAISSVEYNVTQSRFGVRIGATTLPTTTNAQALATAIGSCTPAEVTHGGDQIRCLGNRAMIKIGMSCARKDARGACDEWTHLKLDVMVQVFASPSTLGP